MNMTELTEIKLEIEEFKIIPYNIFHFIPGDLDFIFKFSKNIVRYRIKNINDFDMEKVKIRLKEGPGDIIGVTSDSNGYEKINVYIDIPMLHKGETIEDFKIFFVFGIGQTFLNLYLSSQVIEGNKKIVFTVKEKEKEKEKKYIVADGSYHKIIKVYYRLELLTIILSVASFLWHIINYVTAYIKPK